MQHSVLCSFLLKVAQPVDSGLCITHYKVKLLLSYQVQSFVCDVCVRKKCTNILCIFCFAMHLTDTLMFLKRMVLKIIADFPGERDKVFFLCFYTNLCGLTIKSNKRQTILALTGQSGFPTSCFQQLNCIVQIHNKTIQQPKESFFQSSFSISCLFPSFTPSPTEKAPQSKSSLLPHPSVISLQDLAIGEYLRCKYCDRLQTP